jgi:hypothetical protein
MEKIDRDILIGQAEEHWKRYLPSMYKKLKEAGTLEAEAMNAGIRAADMIEELIAGGLYPFEAREIVLPQYIFLTPETEKENCANGELNKHIQRADPLFEFIL